MKLTCSLFLILCVTVDYVIVDCICVWRFVWIVSVPEMMASITNSICFEGGVGVSLEEEIDLTHMIIIL